MSAASSSNEVVKTFGQALGIMASFALVYALMHHQNHKHFAFRSALVDPMYFSCATNDRVCV